jgi:LacI family transcriptional regulator
LYNSGYLVANLASYILRGNESVLLLNISKRMYKHHHLLRKEEGFRSYFKDHSINRQIEKIDIRKGDSLSIEKEIASVLSRNKDIRLVFVTNSRVSVVAQCLKRLKKKLILIGYDFLEENIMALKDGDIDFLICQKPGEQAYKGIMSLYQHIVLNSGADRMQFMPIDIITKENYQFYKN